MINFTLTITAAPELLAAMSGFTSAITAAKVVTIPQYDSDFTAVNASKEQIASTVSYNQPALQPSSYQEQNSLSQQATNIQQIVQPQARASVTPMYNQPSTVPVNTGNIQGASGPAYPGQAQQQSTPQTPQVQQQASAPIQTPAAQAATVPTSAQTYTMEQLAVAATQLVDAGRRTELLELLSSFGVQALTALPKEQYGAFATQLRALGAKI
jgi:hypothetical protein